MFFPKFDDTLAVWLSGMMYLIIMLQQRVSKYEISIFLHSQKLNSELDNKCILRHPCPPTDNILKVFNLIF